MFPFFRALKYRRFRPVLTILVLILFLLPSLLVTAQPQLQLPPTSNREALSLDWFPSKVHAFVWRNWTVVPVERLAQVLQTSSKEVERVARSMGLQPQTSIDSIWSTGKGYITVLRRNWHLLPYEQLTQLLPMSSQELAWRLIDDDYLYIKLGSVKPHCDPLYYHRPTKEEQQRARQIKKWLKELAPYERTENPRFDFFRFLPAVSEEMTALPPASLAVKPLNLSSSYCGEFGDPLLGDVLSSFPEELLKQLAARGINGLWLHCSLQTLVAPDSLFPGDSRYQERRRNLQHLVNHCQRFGLRIYLYVNEPRATQATYFEEPRRQSLGGVKEGHLQAFCTSDARTLRWLRQSWTSIFSEVKGLGGVFTITASENLTSCASHGRHQQCPRCSRRSAADIISEVNNTIIQGVKQGDPQAEVIVWDWAWTTQMAEAIIPQLDKRCRLMCVSEWSLPIERGGVKTEVGEYSVSAVGPGPRALHHWDIARRCGLPVMAKVQVNTTWELGAVPSIPAMNLIATHARRLAAQQISGIMYCWSVGGYPSVNMSVFSKTLADTTLSLSQLANRLYGSEAAPSVVRAWKDFSDGFSFYPYHISTLYNGPQHSAPANPFYLNATQWKATMVGVPYDDLNSWRGPYPAETYIQLMRETAQGFHRGILHLKASTAWNNPRVASLLSTDTLRASAINLIFSSVANQAEFIYHRDLLSAGNGNRIAHLKTMLADILNEQQLVRHLLPILQTDPTLGYESSNHYFYLPQDLREKYINLRYAEQQMKRLNEQIP